MPVLMDFSQVIIATLFANIGNHTNIDLSEDMIRHMFLSSLRHNRKKFVNDFGELVICCDSKNSWRREQFPYYKAGRRDSREKSEIDWAELFQIINVIREDLEQYFPYKVLTVDRCEADDIIGVICHEYGTPLNFPGNEQILILSGDKDYAQLLKYANIKQYDPPRKRWIHIDDPDKFLFEHILKGDSGDGIPNILSEDNRLTTGVRQQPMTAKRIALFSESLDNMDEMQRLRFERNKKLIDLKETPHELRHKILAEYAEEKTIGRTKLFKFFMDKGLKNLTQDLPDF